MIEQNNILDIYFKILQQVSLNEDHLDYQLAEKYIAILKTLSSVGSSGISVFDLYKKEHIFYSSNYGELLGYNSEDIQKNGQQFLDSRIHPED